MLDAAEWEAVARALRLSGREFEIVRGVFDCQKETAIADGLGIAPRTVNTHLERLYRKLGVTTRVGLVLVVVRMVHRPVVPAAAVAITLATPALAIDARARPVG